MAREKGMGNLQQEKSGRWTMRVGLNGKRYSRSTRTKDKQQAEKILQRFLAPLGLGEKRLPLADVWFEYLRSPNRNELSSATLNSKRVVWMHFAKWMEHFYLPIKDLSGITHETITEYLACLRANICASTYNNRVCVLREIFNVLKDKAGLSEDPWAGVRLRPEDTHSRRELSTEELKRLLFAAKNHKSNKTDDRNEWHSLFLIGIYTGLRLGDCCRLDWKDINVSENIIQLVPQKTHRYARGRPITIPIHPALGKALLRERNGSIQTITSGPILPQISLLYKNTRWKISQEISRIFKAANITTSIRIEGRKNLTPEATFHSLRHTFVSLAANAGVPLHIIQSIVGHESTAMTRHYYHENVVMLREAIHTIPALEDTALY